MKNICIYCGSSCGSKPDFEEAAVQCGKTLAARGLNLIYGGGNVGLMGILADAVLAGGGKVTGVIPRSLVDREVAHTGLTSLITVASMHERKQKMADLADAFVALPGGVGTLEEVIETFTWLQLGIHAKPVGLLNVADYYGPLMKFLANMEQCRFVKREHLDMLLVEASVEKLLDRLATFAPVTLPKWFERNSAEPSSVPRPAP